MNKCARWAAFTAITVFVAVSLSACATPQVQMAYLPSAEGARMGALEAVSSVRRALDTKALQTCEGMHVTGGAWNCPGNSPVRWIERPVVSIVTYDQRVYSVCLRSYASEACDNHRWATVCSSVDARSRCNYADASESPVARRAVDAILVLGMRRVPLVPDRDPAFVRAVERAITNPGNPAAEDEARRRVAVQVDAMRGDNYAVDAAMAYNNYLATDPLWAEGHLNCAVVLANLELYPEAISEAQKYLFLAPDGEDARAAQDQIYRWQALLGVAAAG